MYSQYEEEKIIARYFGDATGTFLDIGANDGKTFSNSRALAERGWGGVCVDASPRAFASLTELYKDRKDVQCISNAVTTKDGPVMLQQASDTLVSSLDPSQPVTWRKYGFQWERVEVQGVTFATLLRNTLYDKFQFITIDAEGHDLDILKQMDLDALDCHMLCIEHGGRIAEVKAVCPSLGEYYRNDINLIMAR